MTRQMRGVRAPPLPNALTQCSALQIHPKPFEEFVFLINALKGLGKTHDLCFVMYNWNNREHVLGVNVWRRAMLVQLFHYPALRDTPRQLLLGCEPSCPGASNGWEPKRAAVC